MQLFPGTYGREPFNERGAVLSSIGYEGLNVAPHIKTLRDTYTIPANKCIKLDMLDSDIISSTVTPAEALVTIEIEVVDLALNVITLHKAFMYGKTITANSSHEHDSNLFISDEATINLYTTDPSAAGTVNYYSKIIFLVFDK